MVWPGTAAYMETTGATARKAVWVSVPIFWVLLTAAPLLDVDFWRGDFLTFYFGFKAAWWGADFYNVRVLNRLARESGVVDRVWPYLYPPFLAQVGAPLGRVPKYRRPATPPARRCWC